MPDLELMIGMIEKFPVGCRRPKGPIDAQLKQRTGISGSEALDPASPLGAALTAYDEVKSTNSRAIVEATQPNNDALGFPRGRSYIPP